MCQIRLVRGCTVRAGEILKPDAVEKSIEVGRAQPLRRLLRLVAALALAASQRECAQLPC